MTTLSLDNVPTDRLMCHVETKGRCKVFYGQMPQQVLLSAMRTGDEEWVTDFRLAQHFGAAMVIGPLPECEKMRREVGLDS